MKTILPATAVYAVVLLTACVVKSGDDARAPDTTAPAPVATAPAPIQTPPPMPATDLRIEVNLEARELYVIRGASPVDTHRVAVGSTRWPTQTGEWTINEVVFNPEWVPPDEEWAKEEPRQPPGARDNPLGRAQLVYDRPRSIHGTNDPASIGRAVSHGSIRVRNEVAVQLAREVMEAVGVTRDESWFTQLAQDRTRQEIVNLPQGIPIRVY